eukprot:m51a1_g4357 hypothetical protein (352) ;mRNA; r:254251-255489
MYTQYNSASDPWLAMRVAVIGTCKDVYATARSFADSQFIFREVAALDNSSGVSFMPFPNPDYYMCSDGTGSGRLVIVKPAISAALCSFKKVAGLSNPSLVSFEQRGQYIGYSKAFDYDCASWFRGRSGWTVGLIDKPANPTHATWISSDAGPLKPYLQGTQYWLGNCGGTAFFTAMGGDVGWNIVPALSNESSATQVSFQLSSNTSLYLGIDAGGAQRMNDSATDFVPVRVINCAGRERLCTWTVAPSTVYSGDFILAITGTNRTLDIQTTNNTLTTYSIPRIPAVIVNTSAGSSTAPDKCPDFKLCRTCITTSMSCGWCAETGVCSQGTSSSPANCSKSQWYFETCVPAK